MTQPDFTTALEQELQLQGRAFSRADLLAFVADAWPLIAEDPDPATWAREFIEAGHGPLQCKVRLQGNVTNCKEIGADARKRLIACRPIAWLWALARPVLLPSGVGPCRA